MRTVLIILTLTLLSAFTGCMQNGSKSLGSSGAHATAENSGSDFLKVIKRLQTGRIDTLKLNPALKIKINPLGGNLSEIASDEAEKGEIDLSDYEPLTKSDVLKITGKYVIVILHNKYSGEIRAATFSPEGKPIETILLHYNYGNNEFKISRTHSSGDGLPFSYDSLKNEFVFTDLRYDTEWLEFPVKGKDTLTYKINFTIQVNENGRFVIIR